jgi:hypothetical protein
MAAFIPGESPPDVNTAILFIVCNIFFFSFSKITKQNTQYYDLNHKKNKSE